MTDTGDIAAAALNADGISHCNCDRTTKSKKPNRSCPKCKGSGKVKACMKCEGSGWNRQTQTTCENCGASGYIAR